MTAWTVRLNTATNSYQDIEADKHVVTSEGDLVFFTIQPDQTFGQSHTYARGHWISVFPTFKSS